MHTLPLLGAITEPLDVRSAARVVSKSIEDIVVTALGYLATLVRRLDLVIAAASQGKELLSVKTDAYVRRCRTVEHDHQQR
jgi:hypothetical protein